MFDPNDHMDAAFAHLRHAGFGPRLQSGDETCNATFDREDVIQTDMAGGAVQVRETVFRVRAGIITKPVVEAALVSVTADGVAHNWIVRLVEHDPANNDLWRITVVAA